MPHKDPEQRRAYDRAKYQKRKLDMARKGQKEFGRRPLRKTPAKAPRRIVDIDKYVDKIMVWLEKRGVT